MTNSTKEYKYSEEERKLKRERTRCSCGFHNKWRKHDCNKKRNKRDNNGILHIEKKEAFEAVFYLGDERKRIFRCYRKKGYDACYNNLLEEVKHIMANYTPTENAL